MESQGRAVMGADMGAAFAAGTQDGRPVYEFRLGDELRGERATMGKTLLDVQRDLRIKAAYIAAIEDLDLEVFPNPSFVPGYVRAYARYLKLDADQILGRFVEESGFVRPKDVAVQPKIGNRPQAAVVPGKPGAFRMRFPLVEVARVPVVPFAAIGSLMVLVALVGGLGYGGWTVLQNIQRVQFAPVDDLPQALAEMAPLDAPDQPALEEPVLTELAQPVASTALAELYRQQEVEVPILTPRDGPIAALDPDRFGPLANAARFAPARPDGSPASMAAAAMAGTMPESGPAADGTADPFAVVLAAVEASLSGGDPASAPGIVPGGPLTVVAERAAWVRVYLPSGTIIFERILESGESYSPPEGVGEPLIWAGNSGSVYVRVGEVLHGPLGSGTRATRDVVLTPAAITARYAAVENVPGIVSQATGVPGSPAQAAVGIQ
jgi:cytoskeletal protein RodZ